MKEPGGKASVFEALLSRTAALVADRLQKNLPAIDGGFDVAPLLPGKMLRTRLAGRLATGSGTAVDLASLARCCAAVEMVHTASLCHDDVIDGAIIRRSASALWRQVGASCAVLIGDVLLCAAIDLVAGVDGGRFVRLFVDKVRQTCAAEVEQELLLRGRKLDQASCLRLARGKTGALFSFIGCLCGDGEVKFSEAMEEACYRVGTAYQIFDDVLDASGREQLAGKTLGTDAARQSFTVVNLSDGQGLARRMITEQLNSALNLLTQWSEAMESLASFIRQDLLPSLSEQGFVDTEKLELDLNPRHGKAREVHHAV